MTREEKLQQLENLCQQKYDLIAQCQQSIAHAQWELEKLEVQYLKAKAKLVGVKIPKTSVRRASKVSKVRKTLLDLGLTSEDIETLINKVK
jgi:hypothetical protein